MHGGNDSHSLLLAEIFILFYVQLSKKKKTSILMTGDSAVVSMPAFHTGNQVSVLRGGMGGFFLKVEA